VLWKPGSRSRSTHAGAVEVLKTSPFADLRPLELAKLDKSRFAQCRLDRMTLSAAQMLSVIAAGPQDSHSREEAKGPRALQVPLRSCVVHHEL
jgi:hypothetical protein